MTLYSLIINEQRYEVEIEGIQGDTAHVIVNQTPFQVKIDGSTGSIAAQHPAVRLSAGPESACPPPKPAVCAIAGASVIEAPIPGKILQFEVRVGDRVKNGQTVAIMEAMKMENNILAPIDGMVKEIRVAAGADVSTGDVIMVVG